MSSQDESLHSFLGLEIPVSRTDWLFASVRRYGDFDALGQELFLCAVTGKSGLIMRGEDNTHR